MLYFHTFYEIITPSYCVTFSTNKGVIRSLLHLAPEEITLVEITNSIEPGTTVDEKEFILDSKVHMNSSVTINLETPVINEHNRVAHMEIATKEDRQYGIDVRASFFKASKRRN